MPETAEQLAEKPEVREALAQTGGEKKREKVKAQTTVADLHCNPAGAITVA